ncbi:MAG: hypothetical protein ACI8SA_001648, partial [Dokdonia sp.]
CIWLWIISLMVYPPLFILGATFLSVYYLAILLDSSFQNKSVIIGLLSVPTSFIQLYAYGIGFFTELKTKLIKG